MQDSVKRVQYRGTGFYVGVLAIVVFALALLVLAVLNTQEVEVDFGFVFTVPLFAVAIGAVIVGVVIDELIGLVWRRQRRIHMEEHAELDRLRAADVPAVEDPQELEEQPDHVPGAAGGDSVTQQR